MPPKSTASRRSAPAIFRVLLQARDLAEARRFYEALLRVRGRSVAPGRIYFDCGPVILGVLDYSKARPQDRSVPVESVYLATHDLEGVYRRAARLGCLATEDLHDDPAQPLGRMVVRPWGERSFYLHDPTGNPLCFVEASTVFTGRPRQARALARRGPPARGR